MIQPGVGKTGKTTHSYTMSLLTNLIDHRETDMKALTVDDDNINDSSVESLFCQLD